MLLKHVVAPHAFRRYHSKVSSNVDVPKLERSLNWALERELPQSELVAMLRPLVRHTSPASERGQLARLQLAEHLLLDNYMNPVAAQQAYWEAAGLLHRLIPLIEPDERAAATPLRARALSAFGLASTFLGHYRLAKRAYLRALKEDPTDPVTAHNLGHLLTVKLASPLGALYWLQRAHAGLPNNVEVAASLAHALVKTQQAERAVAILARVLNDPARASELVTSWLKQAAHSEASIR